MRTVFSIVCRSEHFNFGSHAFHHRRSSLSDLKRLLLRLIQLPTKVTSLRNRFCRDDISDNSCTSAWPLPSLVSANTHYFLPSPTAFYQGLTSKYIHYFNVGLLGPLLAQLQSTPKRTDTLHTSSLNKNHHLGDFRVLLGWDFFLRLEHANYQRLLNPAW